MKSVYPLAKSPAARKTSETHQNEINYSLMILWFCFLGNQNAVCISLSKRMGAGALQQMPSSCLS